MEENNSQAPAALASSAAEAPKKSNGKNVIIALLCVLVIGLGCTVAYLSFNKADTSNSSTSNSQREDIEEEITSVAVKNDLLDKFKRLNTGLSKDGDNFYTRGGYGSSTGLFTNEMTEEVKNYTAIYDAKQQPIGALPHDEEIEIYNGSKVKEYISFEQFSRNNYYIDGDEVAESYRELYGKDIVHQDNRRSCYLSYNAKYNVYYVDSIGCGGGSSEILGIYIDGFRMKGNQAYIDAYAEHAYHVGDNSPIFTVFNDITSDDKVIKKCDSETLCQKISADNKDQFAHYRFVFEGENEDYHFVEVQKM